MAMVVKNNMSAVSTLNTLNKNSSALQKSLQKVSSGMKINSAQDDASGYAISEKMRVQIRSLDQANQNTQNASSMMKTAEGAVSSTVEILKSLKEKAINAATDTNTDSDRVTIQKELDQFIDQIDDNALTTFNGKYLVDGSKSQLGKATHTAMTNQSLQTGTNGDTSLTALHNRNNESLEIEDTDYVTASFVKNGKTYTTKFLVANNTLDTVFGKMNEQYDNEQAAAGTVTDTTKNAAYKTAFAGKANSSSASGTSSASGGNPMTDTTSAAAVIAAASEADILAVANGTNADTSTELVQALALQASTLAGDASTKKEALETAIGTAIGGTNKSVAWSTYDAGTVTPSTYTDGVDATIAGGSDTAKSLISGEVKEVVDGYASGAYTTATDANTAAQAITGTVKVHADASAAFAAIMASATSATIDATAVSDYATAELNSAAGAAAAALFGGSTTTTPSDFKSVNGEDITKANADNFTMKSEDVDALAAKYNVSRTTDDTDETYAAKVLYAAIDKGTETDGDATTTTRGAVGNVSYTSGSFNSVADPDAAGAVVGSDPNYTSIFLNPDKVVDTSTGKMQAYNLSDTAPVAGADYVADSETGVDSATDTAGVQSTGAAAIQDAYNRFVHSTSLGNGTTTNQATTPADISTAFDDISKLANHLSALNAKNADADGIINTVTKGTSTGEDPFTTDQTTKTGLVGVNSAGDEVYTADGTEGLTITSLDSGVNGQISGVTLSISDSEGNVKKSANAALDAFKTTIYAKNKSDSNELSFQVGGAANQSIAVGLDDMRSEALGLKGSDGSKVSVATQDKANAAVAVFDNAIQKALDQQTTIGAVEARLDYTSQNLTTSSENVQAAESTIRDADMAKEMTNYTKNNVLLQAAQSMLAQANQSSSQVLSLLQ